MKKIIFILALTLLLILGACGISGNDTVNVHVLGKSVTSTPTVLPEITAAPKMQQSQTPASAIEADISQFIYYSFENKMRGTTYQNENGEYSIEWVEIEGDKKEGIYRYSLDGAEQELWVEGEYFIVGIYDDNLYFAESNDETRCYTVYKVDVTGKQKQKVFDCPQTRVRLINGAFYYYDDVTIYRVRPGEEAELIAQIPDSVENSIADFIADGEELYFSTYTDEPECWDLYHCNIETGQIELVINSINDYFLIDQGYVYHTGEPNRTEEYIFRYDIETGEVDLNNASIDTFRTIYWNYSH